MHDAIRGLLERYRRETRDDYLNALREILQELALLGLWRAKFFEHAALYGGTALRILHGLDRYSEDLDFSLLKPMSNFSLEGYGAALRREIASFGFEVTFDRHAKSQTTAIESAFLKANTTRELIRIEADASLLQGLHPDAHLKIKLEVDTDPPGGFNTETRYLLQPIPFPVRAYSLPDLFAGKLHAVLCRKWKTRVKGRDWYDLVWYVGRHPQVNIPHLEQRMRQSGDLPKSSSALDLETLHAMLKTRVESLDVASAKKEVAPFVRDRHALDVWSREFFMSIVNKIEPA